MFIQIKNIWYYNAYIHKLKLSINYSDLNITVTPHAEKVSMFTRQISDTRLREILRKINTISCKKYVLKISDFLEKIKCKSANMGSATVNSIAWCRPGRYSYSKLITKNLFLYYIKRMWLYSFTGNLIMFVYKV